MRIRSAQEADYDAVDLVVKTAFGQDDEARLVRALRASGDGEYEFIAEETGARIGHVMLSRLASPEDSLALAPLAVDPAHQKRGIGAALMQTAINKAGADGWAAIFLLGDPAYYQRFGFSVAAAAPFKSPYPPDYMMALELKGGALEAMAGEAMARKIIYAAPFGS